jgi:hypothetical protein|tara:strand:+ start:7288 stop:7497 length:210 start_codon:yes stop_codon:yes gene_type:complete
MNEIKVGDLVRIAKSSIDDKTTTWFARDAENEVPFLVVGDMNEFFKLLRKDQTFCYVAGEYLELIDEIS